MWPNFNYVGTILKPIRDDFEPFCDQFGIILEHVWIIVGSFRNNFGTIFYNIGSILKSLEDHFTIIL